jgi:C1A family cysteine protease
MSTFIPPALGWRRDLPDPRDYSPQHDRVAEHLKQLTPREPWPERIDWREYCAGVDDQMNLAASTAHACVGLLQYFERRSRGRIIEPSRMFVYKTARRLLNWTGDTGATLRATLKAIARFGVPPERDWPYDPANVDEEPVPFAYSFARDFQSVCYVRLDGRDEGGGATLETVRSFLAAGYPSAFGFSVCTSLSPDAEIPFPTVFDAVRGGQAVMAVGYDDNRRIRSDKGALLIRSSWGIGWGDQGYGWLPYSYVREQLASDFWTLIKPDWLASGEFGWPQ